MSSTGNYLHIAGHVLCGIIIGYLFIEFLQCLPLLVFILAIVGSLFFDVDKLLYYTFNKKKYMSFKHYLRWLGEDLHHKKIDAYFHNIYMLSILLVIAFSIGLNCANSFFIAAIIHFLYDIIDDIIYLRRISQWVTLKRE